MGARARALLRWLCHRSRRVSSSFHLTTTTTSNTTRDIHAHSLPRQEREEGEDDEWEEVAEGPESDHEEYIVLEGGGTRAPVRTKPPRMDPSKKGERVIGNKHGDGEYHIELNVGVKPAHASVTDGISKPLVCARSLLKSESIGASKCIGEKQRQDRDESLSESVDETIDEVSQKIAQLKT